MNMAGQEGSDYVRKLDRSPETDMFHNLSKEDKALISQLRAAVITAKDNVYKLRDENEDKLE